MKRPAHIAIDLRLRAYQPAGIARYATELWQAITEQADPAEWRLTALHSVREARQPSVASPAAAPARPIDSPRCRRRYLVTPPHHRLEQWTLPLELLPLGLDLLHSPDFIPPFRRRCRTVVTVHDLAFLQQPGVMTAASRRYYRQVYRSVWSAERVIVPSAATRRDVETLLGAPAARLRVIPEAPSARFRPLTEPEQAAARHRWADGQRYVLFVGTIEPRKNLPNLLRAWAALPALLGGEVPPLLIAGGRGWLADDLPWLAADLGLGRSVRWLGRVDEVVLPALYAGAELFVYPSRYEGFGLPVLEAMASGTPVVTSNVAALPELAGDAAVTVDPHDPSALARACAGLLADAGRRAELRERGLARAASFTWPRAASATLAVFAEALARRRAAGWDRR